MARPIPPDDHEVQSDFAGALGVGGRWSESASAVAAASQSATQSGVPPTDVHAVAGILRRTANSVDPPGMRAH